MKHIRHSKSFIALFLTACLILTGIQGYMSYRSRKAGIRDAMSAHIAVISDNINYAVERLYGIQALVVASGGTDVNLDAIVPLLKKHEAFQYIRCVVAAPDGIVSAVYPEEMFNAYIGTNLYADSHPYSEVARQAVHTGNPVATSFSYLNAQGEQVISICLAVQIPEADGTLRDWGAVAISLAFPDILRHVDTDIELHNRGFDYRLYHQESADSEKNILFTVGDTDFVDPAAIAFFVVNQRLVMEAIPTGGWVAPRELVWSFLTTTVALALVILIVKLLIVQLGQLRDEASLDPLTGLTNRTAAIREIDRLLTSKDFERGVFLMLDLDHFKNVNDTFGHKRGDETLVKCAQQLRHLFRDTDILCRLGGDEFVVFLPIHGDIGFLDKKVDHLLRVMRQDVTDDSAVVSISTSIGIAIAPEHGTDFEELYKCADQALYRSKERGRNVATMYEGFMSETHAPPKPEAAAPTIPTDSTDTLHRSIIEALASAIEFRDMESGEHTNRIYAITKQILSCTAIGSGLSAEEIEDISVGSIMHDLGKIAVSDMILNKPGRLTKEEFEIMKTHTTKGAMLIERLSQSQHHPTYGYARDIALHHHERWDGNGYPHGLKGNEISVWAQVVGIADVYDALISPRVYKKPFSPDTAVKMIVNHECGVFNPALVECFLQVEPVIRTWYEHDRPQPIVIPEQRAPAPSDTAEDGDPGDYLLLTAAVQSAYDMIISCNLTRNQFRMVDYERFQTHCADYDGVFDDLIAAGASSVPESHRQAFIDTFSRESLLEAYAQGKKSVNLHHPQYTDDGGLMNVSTTVLFAEDPRNGDIRQITLAQYLPGSLPTD